MPLGKRERRHDSVFCHTTVAAISRGQNPIMLVSYYTISSVRQMHAGLGIPIARDRIGFQDVRNLLHFVVGQLDGLRVLLDPLDLGGARDGDDGSESHLLPIEIDRASTQLSHPGDGDLRPRHALLLGQLPHLIHDAVVLLEHVVLKLGHVFAEIAVGDVGVLPDTFARQGSSTEGAVGDDRDAQPRACLGHAVPQDVRAAKETDLDLDGGDGVHRVRAFDRARLDLGQSDAANLAFLDELGEVADGVLDGHVRVDARTLEDVDLFGPVEDLEAVLDRPPDVLPRPVRFDGAGLAAPLDAEHDSVRVIGVQGEVLLEQVARVAPRRAVDLAAVPEIRPQVERLGHGLVALFRRLGRRTPRQAHEAVSDGSDWL